MRIEYVTMRSDYVVAGRAYLLNIPPDSTTPGHEPGPESWASAPWSVWTRFVLPILAVGLICAGGAGFAGWYSLRTTLIISILLISASLLYGIWTAARVQMWIAKFRETGECDPQLEVFLARAYRGRLGKEIIEIDSHACSGVNDQLSITLEWKNVREVWLEPTHFIIRSKSWPHPEFIGIPVRALPPGTDTAALLAVFKSLQRGEPVAGFE